MGKNDSKGPSRPYRGGHTGKGGSHEKVGCLAALVVLLLIGGGTVAGSTEALRALL
jgi:hypothetical protein